MLISGEPWSSKDSLDIEHIPHYDRLANKLLDFVKGGKSVLIKLVLDIANAMLKCVQKQLVDFLPGSGHSSVYGSEAATENSHVTFAPVTNVAPLW